jgi:acetolactate decarboxylase
VADRARQRGAHGYGPGALTLDPHLIHAVHATRGHGAAFQTSTLAALLHGAYLGDVTVAQLAARGDHGLGTFDFLDGELVLADGVAYRAADDGSVTVAEPQRRCPFAVVTLFGDVAGRRLDVALEFEELLAELDRDVPASAVCSAVRLDGRFASVRLRSVPAQSEPFRPLDVVLAQQRVFDLDEVDGTVVGFRFQPAAAGLDVPGFHLHFLSADRTSGGHVLRCATTDVVARIDPDADLDLELPPGVELPEDAADLGALADLEEDR